MKNALTRRKTAFILEALTEALLNHLRKWQIPI